MKWFKTFFCYFLSALPVFAQTTETITNSKTILTPEDYATNLPEYFLPAGTQVKVEGGWAEAYAFSSRTSFFLKTNLPTVLQMPQDIDPLVTAYQRNFPYDTIAAYGAGRNICSYTGPLYLRILPRAGRETNRFTITVERNGLADTSTNNSLLSPNTAVVVPTSVTGDVDIILEQSQDGVTWTQCLPGIYNSSTVKRFFRLRAVEK